MSLRRWISALPGTVTWVTVGAGAVFVNVALYEGLGVDFGWWGAAFWFGLGCIIAAVIAELRR